MAENSASALHELYDCVRQGSSIFEFRENLQRFWLCEKVKRQFLYEIRFSKCPCKKLMDEIMPVARFLRLGNISAGFVRFPLDDEIPDCFLRREDDVEHHKIEVTVAQGKARFHWTKYLEENGSSSGVITLQDDSSEDFTRFIIDNQGRLETDEVLEAVREAIKIAMKKKDDAKYAGMDLLISAPLSIGILPSECWERIMGDLSKAAVGMPFREIHVIGNDEEQPIGFRIK